MTTATYTRPSEADLPAALAEDVEKAAQELALGLGVSVSAGPYAYRTQPRITTLISAVRAEAIASTEAKFRELAEGWERETIIPGYDDYLCGVHGCARELQSLLTPCPQSRHDAGEEKP